MCGIFGCISDEAASRVLDALKKLEYRGYDSAGLAALFPRLEDPIMIKKTVGFVSDLAKKENGKFRGSNISIGHTRWATHGRVSETNAHPHLSNGGMVAIVHNGIIENATELAQTLAKEGYDMKSETDSEVIAQLIEKKLLGNEGEMSPLLAFESMVSAITGSWAIASMVSGLDGILVAKKGSPMIIGRVEDEFAISSDLGPLYGHFSEFYPMKDDEIFFLSSRGIVPLGGSEKPNFQPLEGNYMEQDPGKYQHMMLKEIFDQPISLSNVIGGRLSSDGKNARLSGFNLGPEQIRQVKRINLVGCGSAYFAALIGKYYMIELSNLEVNAFRSSEFDAQRFSGPNTLTIGITQSGETKDTHDALENAKNTGGHISSICNVLGSSIARLTGNGAYLHAGPEYAVASTKAFTSMVVALLLLSISVGDPVNSPKKKIIQNLRSLPNTVRKQLEFEQESVYQAAKIISESDRVIIIGKGISSLTAMEAALKIMEVTYVPCLAYPAGELKHGPLALIQQGTPVIVIDPEVPGNHSHIKSNIEECRARGAKIIRVTNHQENIAPLEIVVSTENNGYFMSPIIDSIPLQLISYQAALIKGLNPDRPRNLAKSVTVE